MKKTHSNNFVGAEEVEFKKDTELFLRQIIKDHLNAHMDSYMKRYYGRGTNTFTGWKNLLFNLMEEIKYRVEVNRIRSANYLYRIKIINHFVNVKEHGINILIINTETDCILKVNIVLEKNSIPFKDITDSLPVNGVYIDPLTLMGVIVSVKVGSIVFEPDE